MSYPPSPNTPVPAILTRVNQDQAEIAEIAISPLPGFKTLLLGGTGTGKTYSLGRLAELGFKVRILFTEPGHETVGKYFADRNQAVPHNIAWHYIKPAAPSWDMMLKMAKNINTLSFKAMSELTDPNRSQYDEFLDILGTCARFLDDRSGEDLGAVDSWGTDTVFAVDSLTGLSIAAKNLVTGAKPVVAPGEWGTAMDNLERFITALCIQHCHVVLIGHLERETDEVSGAITNMASTLGKKLAPKIPRFFSDVIQAKREQANFFWATDSINTDLKARNLPIQGKILDGFSIIAKQWVRNGGLLEHDMVLNV
jgi:hypothetical protein